MQTTTLGLTIEAVVCAFLEKTGLRCLTKNYRCRLGEIDLVMHEPPSDTLIFVEVRFRSRAEFGNATESVNATKQRKLKRAVLHYLQKNADARQIARIDVIGVNKVATDMPARCDAMCALASSDESTAEFDFGVTTHLFQGYQLRWTRNAIEG